MLQASKSAAGQEPNESHRHMLVIDLSHSTVSEWATMIVGIASLISAVGSCWAAISASRNTSKIQEVHDATNGMKAELVQSTADRMYAEGRQHGEDYPRKRPRKKPSKPKLKKKV